MEDERPNPMNLDLNLGPIDHSADDTETRSGSLPTEAMNLNLEDWLDGSYRIREVVRRRRWRSVLRQFQVPPEARNIALESMGASGLQTGEGSVTAEVRTTEATKTCDNNDGFLEDGILGKKDDDEKANADAGSFFDCNICLDLAKDPVVTCCGHLFCWPCLYRWLHLHSDAKECPVCKGEVTMKNVTPIYGRGKSARQVAEDDSSAKIPHRPQARRVESWRQAIQRTAFTIPMEEMIRRLNNRFDLSQVHPNDVDSSRESPERSSSSLLNRILTSRGLRREQGNVILPDDVVDKKNINCKNLFFSFSCPKTFIQSMASVSNSFAVLSLFLVVSLMSGIHVTQAARQLLQTSQPTFPTIPSLPQPSFPTIPNMPTATLPPLPTLPTNPTLPPLPSIGQIPTLPTSFPSIPNIPTAIPSLPFLSPPPSN